MIPLSSRRANRFFVLKLNAVARRDLLQLKRGNEFVYELICLFVYGDLTPEENRSLKMRSFKT